MLQPAKATPRRHRCSGCRAHFSFQLLLVLDEPIHQNLSKKIYSSKVLFQDKACQVQNKIFSYTIEVIVDYIKV